MGSRLALYMERLAREGEELLGLRYSIAQYMSFIG